MGETLRKSGGKPAKNNEKHWISLNFIKKHKINIKKQDGTLFYNGTTKIDDIKQLIEYVAKATKLWRESAGQGAGNNGQGNNGQQNNGAGGLVESENTKKLRERLGA